MAKYNKIVIGVDQSYTSTGISIAIDGKLKKVTSVNLKAFQTNSEKRRYIKRVLNRIITKNSQKASEMVILCERISTYRKAFGSKGNMQGANPNYLKMTGALVAVLVDTAAEYGINVYSVDTRSWKSKIVGSSKSKNEGGKREAKMDTVKHVEKLGFSMFIREKQKGKNKGEAIYDDDAADSGCIALYGFLPNNKQNLKLEE